MRATISLGLSFAFFFLAGAGWARGMEIPFYAAIAGVVGSLWLLFTDEDLDPDPPPMVFFEVRDRCGWTTYEGDRCCRVTDHDDEHETADGQKYSTDDDEGF